MNALIVIYVTITLSIAGCSSSSSVDLSSLLATLYDSPQCEEFLGDAAWVVVDDKTVCGNANCDLPREICMENAEMAFSEGNRQIQCRALPSACAEAVNSGQVSAGPVESSVTTLGSTVPLTLSSESPTTTIATTTTVRHVEIIVATDAPIPATSGTVAPPVEIATANPDDLSTPKPELITISNIPSSTEPIETTDQATTPTIPIAPTVSQENDICTIGRNMGRPGKGCDRTYSFYFDGKQKMCARMLYWGCGGNANRFPTKLECEQASARCDQSVVKPISVSERPFSAQEGDICNQRKPVGRFCGYKQMFYYNVEQRTCQQFWFPGCRSDQTNENLFESEEECTSVARICNGPVAGEGEGDGDIDSAVHQVEKSIAEGEDACHQPRNIGHQNCPEAGWVRKFFFDTNGGVCKSFWYQGCDGNTNRFDSISECRQQCLSPIR